MCYVIVLLPFTAMTMHEWLKALINWMSRGNQNLANAFWMFLYVSLGGIVLIWIVAKMTDSVLNRKYKGKDKVQTKSTHI